MSKTDRRHAFDLPKGAMNKMPMSKLLGIVLGMTFAAAVAAAPEVTGVLGEPGATTTISGKQLPPPPPAG